MIAVEAISMAGLGVGMAGWYLDGKERSRDLIVHEYSNDTSRKVVEVKRWFRKPEYDITLIAPVKMPYKIRMWSDELADDLGGMTRGFPLRETVVSWSSDALPFPEDLKDDPSYRKKIR